MSSAHHHNEWLSLVPNSGPFLSLPVLAQAFPQELDAHDADHARRLRMAFGEWDEDQATQRPDPSIHRAWVKLVLEETLGFEGLLAEGQAIPQTLKSEVAEYGETLRPDWIVNDPTTGRARLLVQVFPRSQALSKPVQASRWKNSPDTRMMQLLHDTGVRLGIVTNGDHWMLVNAPKGETTGYASWYANLWLEEPVTLRAFRTLLGSDRFFSVPEGETLEALLDKSIADQQEVTDQLGYQVRKAVEVLVQAIDKADQDHGRKLLADVDERVLYESALTVMMRLVFLFCAEERELLLLGDDLYDKNFAVSTMRDQLEVAKSHFTEDILGLRFDAWPRLLTTFRAVYAGARHDRLKLPAYGGSLFNPDRFPFLEGRPLGTSWKDTEATPLPVSNRTVLHLLEALQVLQVRLPGGGRAEARKLSFRSLDIEQIGHVYEGLLDHTARRATEPVLGLQGTRDKEPEITLAELERIAGKAEKDLLKFLKDETGRSESALKKGLNAEPDDHLASRFRTASQDSDLWERVKPFAGLVRRDTFDYPVVITPGSVFVTAGTDRRSSGTHYTPRSLTEPIVQYTLEPLVYLGPAEGLTKEKWTLRPAEELLALKICDMACGSGAFLVQVCRYLAARLMEAWDEVQRAHPGTLRITPEGRPSTGQPGEMLIPDDPDERQTYALRIVAQRCVYGVDKNPLAVEMAKLSLWLLTLAKDKPFEFLDHAIRCGDSLVGIHNLDQLRKFNLDGKGENNSIFLQFLDPRIKEAIGLRRQITEMQANTVEDVEAQDRMLREANEKIDRLKYAADFLIAAEFTPGSAADKRAARVEASIKVAVHFNHSDLETFRQEAQKALAGQATFHWPLEFPEVMVERGGFDAFLGNPPFMGGRLIGRSTGEEYHTFLERIRRNVKGSPDLCAYFLLRAATLVRSHGALGFLATKTITETGTRSVCLDQLISRGSTIYNGIPRRSWPGDASVFVAHVHLYQGSWNNLCYLGLDQIPVEGINGALEAVSGDSESFTVHQLVALKGRFSQGQDVMGRGFELTEGERHELIVDDPQSEEVIRPLFNGRDLNTLPVLTPYRWVIYFRDWSQVEAQKFEGAFRRLDQLVRPYREGLTGQIHQDCFWKFWDLRPQLVKEMESHLTILASPVVTKYVSFRVVPTTNIYNHKTKLYYLYDWRFFATLQSSIHQEWAHSRCATLGGKTFSYSTSAAFVTWPMPQFTLFGNHLDRLGEQYHFERECIMIERSQGLTDTYNQFHDMRDKSANITQLRNLKVEIDEAVASAFSWTNLDLKHDFYEVKGEFRFTISEPARRDVLARLLKLNHERYAEEVRQGLHDKKTPKSAKGKGRGKPEVDREASASEGTLFNLEAEG